MIMISNLSRDLVEEILLRVPLRSLKAVRSTCKMWNALTKERRFMDKHIAKLSASKENEYLMFDDSRVHLVGVDLHRNQNENVDLSINRKGELIRMENSDELFQISQIFFCNGLLLCVSNAWFVIWSPYWGKPKWIKRSYKYGRSERFAFGYDKSCSSYNILMLYGNYLNNVVIYDLSSESWMAPNVTLERDTNCIEHSASVNGNTCWYVHRIESPNYYLFCFNFTRKRFGPRLTLPDVSNRGIQSLAATKENQFAVLCRYDDVFAMEFWVTEKIEPEAVSWRNFLRIDMKPLRYSYYPDNFLIDQEIKLAVLFDKEWVENTKSSYNNIAYVIGENGYFRKVVLNETWCTPGSGSRFCRFCFPGYVHIK